MTQETIDGLGCIWLLKGVMIEFNFSKVLHAQNDRNHKLGKPHHMVVQINLSHMNFWQIN